MLLPTSIMHCFIANNGVKPREIHAPHFKDRVLHHWLVPQLAKIIEPKFIYDSAANIKNKGTHFAVKRLQKFMRQLQATHRTAYDTSNTKSKKRRSVIQSRLKGLWLKLKNEDNISSQ